MDNPRNGTPVVSQSDYHAASSPELRALQRSRIAPHYAAGSRLLQVDADSSLARCQGAMFCSCRPLSACLNSTYTRRWCSRCPSMPLVTVYIQSLAVRIRCQNQVDPIVGNAVEVPLQHQIRIRFQMTYSRQREGNLGLAGERTSVILANSQLSGTYLHYEVLYSYIFS